MLFRLKRRIFLMKKLFSLALLVLVSGCSDDGYKPFDRVGAKRSAAFKAEQYKPYAVKGKGRISGDFCLDATDGQKRCLPDQAVLLNPVTDYSTEWYNRYWKGGEMLETPNGEASRRSRMVRTDRRGRFTFTGLPAGEYYVGAVACPFAQGGKEKAGFSYQRWGACVTVPDKMPDGKRSVEVVLEKLFEQAE